MVCQNSTEFDIKSAAKDIEERFKACPRREVVAQFQRKHHKQVWQKEAMGPPSDVFVDVKQNDSLLWPYILTVEFTLRYSFGPERQSKQQAQEDSQLDVELAVGKLLTTRYRNTYLVSRDGIRVKTREFFPVTLDGMRSSWKERSIWPDACWDQIAAK